MKKILILLTLLFWNLVSWASIPEEYVTSCASFVWHGMTYNTSGTYYDTLVAVNGDDSIVSLFLDINPIDVRETSVLVLDSDMPYSWNGILCDTAGTYQITFSNVYGCDSIITLNLTVVTPITYTADAKLEDVRDHAFDVDIVSHTFVDGIGTITFSGEVTKIGDMAFDGCHSLTSITIPKSVTSIGHSAFRDCSTLTSITIPSSVTNIGQHATFSGCSGLTSMIVEPGNTVYDSRNNCNAIIETARNTLIFGCKNSVIPNTVTNLGDSAFAGCFRMESIVIPSSVTSIGWQTFAGCSGLKSITCLAVNPPTVGYYVFWYDVPRDIPLYVPAASISLYKSAEQWNEFDIQPILVDIDPITPDTTNLTWNPVDSASLYKLHLYTDSTSSVGLDTTLLITADSLHGGTMASSGFATVQRVHHVALDDIGSVVIITIDPTSGTSADNPYLVTVSTTSGERIEVHYGMTVLNGTKVIREDAGSFVLNDAILDAIENIYAPSFPSGIYDLHGRRYSMAVWESLPAGVYILKKDNRVVKVMK